MGNVVAGGSAANGSAANGSAANGSTTSQWAASLRASRLGALFIKAKESVYIRTMLEEIGHNQPPTPVQTDNSAATGVVNNIIQPK